MTAARRRVLLIASGVLALVVVLFFALAPRIAAGIANHVVEADLGDPSAEATRIHGSLVVADLHADALLWDRDLLARAGYGHVDVPRLIEGRVALQAFTVVTQVPFGMNIESNSGNSDAITLLAVAELWPPRTWGSLLERALYQADRLRRFAADSRGRLALVRTREDLEGFLSQRDAGEPTVAGVLGLEGAHALEGDLSNVAVLYQAGYRIFGLTHFFDNEVGGSAHGLDKGGLTDFGRRVVGRMEQLGIAIDLAHASPALIDDVLDVATRPVLVSHTGVKGTCDNTRNLDDDRLLRIAEGGGVVGIGLWSTAVCGDTPEAWAAAVRHAVDVAGADHVALGSDWDGAITAIVDAAGTVHLTDALVRAGFAEDDVRKIMGGNVVRILGDLLPPLLVPPFPSG